MNYLTASFNSNRIVPTRKLMVPLTEVRREKRDRPLPFIVTGKLYSCSKKAGLVIENEVNLEKIEAPANMSYAGILAAGNDRILLETVQDGSCFMSVYDLSIQQRCSHVAYRSEGKDTLVLDHYSLVYLQVGSEWLSPIHLARKEHDECVQTWDFLPKSPNYRFGYNRGKVIIQGTGGDVYSIDAGSGEMLWSKSTEELGVLTPEEINTKNKGEARDYPHIWGDVIVLGSHFGYLIGVGLETGELVWKRQIEGNAGYPCVTEDGKVYKFTNFRTRKSLLILDAATGETVQEWDLAGAAKALGISDLLSYQSYGDVTETHFWGTTTHGLLFAVNLATGEIDWHENLGETIPYGDPFIICNNRLYMTTMNQLITFEGAGGYIKD